MEKLLSLTGCFVIIGIAYLFSVNKNKIDWRLVIWGIALQVIIGIVVIPESFFNQWLAHLFKLNSSPGAWFFEQLNLIVNAILGLSDKGMAFMLGKNPSDESLFNNFVFRGLPIIVFFSSLISVLYHIGIMQKFINFFAVIMSKTMKTSGAESLAVASNVFVGMIEAVLSIKPLISTITRSELFAVMVSGMATVAGSVMGVYVTILKDAVPNITGHLITASVMSAPAAFVLAKIMIPEDAKPDTMGHLNIKIPKQTINMIDAAATGAKDGLKLAMNVGAILLSFVALIYLVNLILTTPQTWLGIAKPYTFEELAGYLFTPIAYLMGIPWSDASIAGSLLGKKVVINEWIAYADLAGIVKQGKLILTDRTKIILSYALCGFANLGSIGIMIGGISSLAPDRSSELAQLGLKSMLGGLLAGFLTACVAGIII